MRPSVTLQFMPSDLIHGLDGKSSTVLGLCHGSCFFLVLLPELRVICMSIAQLLSYLHQYNALMLPLCAIIAGAVLPEHSLFL